MIASRLHEEMSLIGGGICWLGWKGWSSLFSRQGPLVDGRDQNRLNCYGIGQGDLGMKHGHCMLKVSVISTATLEEDMEAMKTVAKL